MAIRCRSEGLVLTLMVVLAACKPGAERQGQLAPVGEQAVAVARTACEGRGGQWVTMGKAALCVTRTRDGGKSCQAGGECEGDCLARSMTCAPAKPLLGCNDVMSDGGLRVSQCFE